MALKYKRVLLKLSGEAMAGEKHFGLDYPTVSNICKSIKECVDIGAEVAIVVGGGNFWRGRSSGEMERTRADHIGMLATVMNALSLADALESQGVDVRVQTAITMQAVAEPYIRNKAVRHLQKGRVVIFGCGTGNPFFSTDTAAALRSVEINADVILMAKMIDGVYSADPKKDPNAVRYDEISFSEILNKELAVIDSTAASLCRDNNMPVLIFSLEDPNNIVKAIQGDTIGTILREEA
ncbi:MAG: UMP kinase [Oscillospiraceae bacterium]|nr:UMP kinase [Oscillospiraceae bacterium]